MKEYFSGIVESIAKAAESIDEAVFTQLVNECVETLNAGHKIIASGLGKNVPVCDKFVGTMLSLGQSAGFMHTNTAVHGDIGMVEDGDLVIVLSKTGETTESIYLVSLLKQRAIKLWLLTFQEDSSLTRDIPNSLVLMLDHEGDDWNIVPNNSTTVNLMVLQGLAIHIARKRDITIQDFKKNHPGGYIGVQLKNV